MPGIPPSCLLAAVPRLTLAADFGGTACSLLNFPLAHPFAHPRCLEEEPSQRPTAAQVLQALREAEQQGRARTLSATLPPCHRQFPLSRQAARCRRQWSLKQPGSRRLDRPTSSRGASSHQLWTHMYMGGQSWQHAIKQFEDRLHRGAGQRLASHPLAGHFLSDQSTLSEFICLFAAEQQLLTCPMQFRYVGLNWIAQPAAGVAMVDKRTAPAGREE